MTKEPRTAVGKFFAFGAPAYSSVASICILDVISIIWIFFRIVFFDISSVSLAKPLIHRAGYVEDEDGIDRSRRARGNAAADVLLKRHLIRVVGDMRNGLVHDNAACLAVRIVWLFSVRKCRERQEREDHADAHEKRKSAFSYIHCFSSF